MDKDLFFFKDITVKPITINNYLSKINFQTNHKKTETLTNHKKYQYEVNYCYDSGGFAFWY